jgi:hypothetical protein
MAIGEAAGIAASMAVEEGLDVLEIPVETLQRKLLDRGATLVYFKDLTPDDPDFASVQKFALRGLFPGWEARLDETLDAETADRWSELAGKKLPNAGNITRREAIRQLSR